MTLSNNPVGKDGRIPSPEGSVIPGCDEAATAAYRPRLLDLFSGIGGFSLGLERAGFETVAFCEISPKPQHLLATHWPAVPIFGDITTLTGEQVGRVDAICGGFPCQDISLAGKGAGLAGERSGLWSEYARLVRELRPTYVIVENVAALLGRGLGDVLGDLAALGYDAWWDCIPASAVGAPHRRDRLWLVAYPGGVEHEGYGDALRREVAAGLSRAHQMDDADARGREACGTEGNGHDAALRERQKRPGSFQTVALAGGGEDVAHTDIAGLEGRKREGLRECAGERAAGPRGPSMADAQGDGRNQGSANSGGRGCGGRPEQGAGPWSGGWWLSEPDVGRVAHGVPARVDRLHGLGNAVVPQIPEIIGRAILTAEAVIRQDRAA